MNGPHFHGCGKRDPQIGVLNKPNLGHDATVYAHLAAQDQLLRVPSRSNPRPRNDFLQPLLHRLSSLLYPWTEAWFIKDPYLRVPLAASMVMRAIHSIASIAE